MGICKVAEQQAAESFGQARTGLKFYFLAIAVLIISGSVVAADGNDMKHSNSKMNYGESKFYIAPTVATSHYAGEPQLLKVYGNAVDINGNLFRMSLNDYRYSMSSSIGLNCGFKIGRHFDLCGAGNLTKITRSITSTTYDTLGTVLERDQQVKATWNLYGGADLRYLPYIRNRFSAVLKAGMWIGGKNVFRKTGYGSTFGVGVRYSVTRSIFVLVEVDRRDNWRTLMKAVDFYDANDESHYRVAVTPQFMLFGL